MRQSTRLHALQGLTALKFRAVQTEMAELQAQEAALRENLAQLVQEKQVQDTHTRNSPAMIAGADIRWQRWVDQRRAAINMELAQVMAKKAECRVRLQRAFGQDQAAQKLCQTAKSAARQDLARKARYES